MIANPSRVRPDPPPGGVRARGATSPSQRLVAVGRLTAAEGGVHRRRRRCPTEINQVQPGDAGLLRRGGEAAAASTTRASAPPARSARTACSAAACGSTRRSTRGRSCSPPAPATTSSPRSSPEGTPAGTTPARPGPGRPARRATPPVRSCRSSRAPARCGPWSAAPASSSDKYNIATQGVGRSGGSTFKIFVLMALLENGYVPNDSVNGGGPCTFTDIPGMFPDPYKVENFGNSGGGGGTITSQTLRSSNCAYVRLGQIVGIDNVVEQARRMGITTPLDDVVSMPLGTKEVHPIDMAARRRVDRRRRHVQRAVLRRPGRGPRRRGAPRARRRTRAGPMSVQSARLAAEVLEKNVAERHRHQGPDPRPARGRQDRHRPGRQRRLVRRLHALPGHRGVDRLADRQRRGARSGGTGHHRRLVPGRDLGPVHAGVARGARRSASSTSPSRPPARGSTSGSTASTTPAAAGTDAGAARRPSTTPARRPPTVRADHGPAETTTTTDRASPATRATEPPPATEDRAGDRRRGMPAMSERGMSRWDALLVRPGARHHHRPARCTAGRTCPSRGRARRR